MDMPLVLIGFLMSVLNNGSQLVRFIKIWQPFSRPRARVWRSVLHDRYTVYTIRSTLGQDIFSVIFSYESLLLLFPLASLSRTDQSLNLLQSLGECIASVMLPLPERFLLRTTNILSILHD